MLSRRALGRATLARQFLLRRTVRPAIEMIDHLVGMQAQAPNAPYVGLWTRLDAFAAADPAALLAERRTVRAPLMRCTLHLVSAADCLTLRPLVQPVLARDFAGRRFARDLAGLDLDEVLAAGRDLLAERPRTRAELGPLLAERWPGHDATALAYAITYLAPLVQVTPRGVWGGGGPAAWTTVESWLGRPLDPAPSPERMVLRYLAAYGPAGVRDMQTWSGLTRLKEVAERLAPKLRRFRDEDGAELYDLPDAPRPDADVPAPPRFLPEYDNVLLSHADRRRFIPDGRRVPLFPGNGASMGFLLVAGVFAGTWRIERAARRVTEGAAATLVVEPFAALRDADHAAVAEEGERLLAFAAPAAERHEVRLHRPD